MDYAYAQNPIIVSDESEKFMALLESILPILTFSIPLHYLEDLIWVLPNTILYVSIHGTHFTNGVIPSFPRGPV